MAEVDDNLRELVARESRLRSQLQVRRHQAKVAKAPWEHDVYSREVEEIEAALAEVRAELEKRYAQPGPQQNIMVFGESASINIAGAVANNGMLRPPVPPRVEPVKDPATRRQEFYFDFLGQALRQADITHRMSLIVMSLGAVIVLVGAALALARAGGPAPNSLPLLTSLSGVLITTCGGAFTVQASRARKHLATQAERVSQQIEEDARLAHARELIDQVQRPDLKDRLNAVNAMRVMGLSPDPDTVTDKVLDTTSPPPELEPGDD